MMEIQSAFVSCVPAVGFADAAAAAETVAGTEVTAGRVRLEVGGWAGSGFAGATTFRAILHTGAPFVRPLKVEVVVSPWSAGRTEVGIRPVSNVGGLDSWRAARYFDAAQAVLPALVDRLVEAGRTAVPAELELVA